jgi:hypothetical protein
VHHRQMSAVYRFAGVQLHLLHCPLKDFIIDNSDHIMM